MAVLLSKECDAKIMSWRKDSDWRVLSFFVKHEDRLINLVNM